METTKISSPQGTQPAQGARSRTAPQDGAASAPTGFLALLAALEDAGPAGPLPVEDGAGVPALAADALTAAGLQPGADLSAIAAWQSLLPSQGHPAGGGLAAAGSLTGASLRTPSLDGATGGTLSQALDAQGVPVVPGGALPGLDGLPQGLVAETAALDTASDWKAGIFPSAFGGHSKSSARLQGAMSQRADAATSGAASLRSGELAASPSLVPHGAAAGAAVLAQFGERMAAELSSRAGPDRAGDGAAGTDLASVAPEGLAAFAAPAGSADAAGPGGRHPGEGGTQAGAWFESASGLGSVETAGAEGTPAFADPAQGAVEEQVAEQVSYWINQRTQNAELTLQRDGQAVEVSVTLTGNEAHVAFRSDQSQTRELLDSSMAQLSELLRSQGLVLSGMTVGTSAGQGEDASKNAERQGQPSRQGARQAQVAAAAPAGGAALSRVGSPDRSVDVFV